MHSKKREKITMMMKNQRISQPRWIHCNDGQWSLFKLEGWIGCAAHQIQLVVNDELKLAKSKQYVFLPQLKYFFPNYSKKYFENPDNDKTAATVANEIKKNVMISLMILNAHTGQSIHGCQLSYLVLFGEATCKFYDNKEDGIKW